MPFLMPFQTDAKGLNPSYHRPSIPQYKQQTDEWKMPKLYKKNGDIISSTIDDNNYENIDIIKDYFSQEMFDFIRDFNNKIIFSETSISVFSELLINYSKKFIINSSIYYNKKNIKYLPVPLVSATNTNSIHIDWDMTKNSFSINMTIENGVVHLNYYGDNYNPAYCILGLCTELDNLDFIYSYISSRI